MPETQPYKSYQAHIHGGYHITLFPETKFSEHYSIVDVMKTFKVSNVPWTLPQNAKLKINYTHYDSIWIKDYTLSKLMDHLQQSPGDWDPLTRWEPLHLTLSDRNIRDLPVLDAETLYETFSNEKNWYVQLVERIPKVSNPKTKLDYEYRWIKNQRTRLYLVL